SDANAVMIAFLPSEEAEANTRPPVLPNAKTEESLFRIAAIPVACLIYPLNTQIYVIFDITSSSEIRFRISRSNTGQRYKRSPIRLFYRYLGNSLIVICRLLTILSVSLSRKDFVLGNETPI